LRFYHNKFYNITKESASLQAGRFYCVDAIIKKEEDAMSTLLSISVALLAGLLMTRAFKPFKLPSVTAYLIAGVLIGPYCIGALHIDGLGFTSADAVHKLSLISEVALGFIAFSIGSEFRLEELKQTGKQAFVIGIVQALVATLFVDIALLVVHLVMPDKLSVPQLITLGAIATATAPAATLMVVRQYKAKGPLTSLLLPIVALDDAVGLVVFAVSFGIARTLSSGVVDLISILVNPLVEIAASLALGAVLGSGACMGHAGRAPFSARMAGIAWTGAAKLAAAAGAHGTALCAVAACRRIKKRRMGTMLTRG